MYELTDVVVSRTLEAVHPDDSRTAVQISIGRPFPDPLPGGDWCCTFRITGLGDETVRAAFGVDTLQALLLTVFKVRLELSQRAESESVRLEWLGGSDLGLQVQPNLDPR